MATIDRESALLDIAAIEEALRAGYAPRGGKPVQRVPGAIAVAAKARGVSRQTMDDRVAPGGVYERMGLFVDWFIKAPEDVAPLRKEAQSQTEPRRYASPRKKEYALLTSAQNDTDVNMPFLNNLKAYAEYLGNTRLLCGKFTYQTAISAERDRADRKKEKQEYKWAPILDGLLVSERTEVGGALFCAEMNTLPTANRPLSGLHTYGQGRTAIFPHAKVALETVPLAHGDLPPLVLTTGACTLPNYTDTKAGHKGQFHHVFGAVIAEIGPEGFTPLRHVIAHNDGTFQDLDVCVNRYGSVSTGNRVEAITYGDIHSPYLDPACAFANWGIDVEQGRIGHGLVDDLRPRYQFFHDLIDHAAISHHEEHNTIERYKRFLNDQYLVQEEIDQAAVFLRDSSRDFSHSIVVRSNHDRWLSKWLDRCDHRKDRPNALAYLELEYARHKAAAEGDVDFDIVHFALRNSRAASIDNVSLLREGQGFQICQDTGGIECGDHFDLGPNGTRGTPTALARVSGKANGGDKHAPQILDGLYVAGVSCRLRRGYNRAGPSSWRHANIITYPNGKRTLLFVEKGACRI